MMMTSIIGDDVIDTQLESEVGIYFEKSIASIACFSETFINNDVVIQDITNGDNELEIESCSLESVVEPIKNIDINNVEACTKRPMKRLKATSENHEDLESSTYVKLNMKLIV